MNLRRFYLVSGIALAVMVAFAAWGLARVGLGAQVPMHWNVQGEADRFGPAWLSFLLLPVITAGIVGLMALIPRIEPRRENLRRSADAYRTMAIAVVLLMAVIQVAIVLSGVGIAVPVALVVGMGVGILFVVMGNVMGTVRSNFMFGVRTPWTLASDRSWDRTHRLMGRLFVITGLLVILASLTGQMVVVMAVLLVGIAIILVGGYWYSYQVWRDDPDRRPTGSNA
jgi:uncharacterized membrane protein